MQSQLHEFNEANVKYQASVQESMAEFQTQNQMNIVNEERSQQRQFQNAIQDAKVILDNNSQSIQKFQAELSEYQAEVGEMSARAQGYMGTAQGYSNEATVRLQMDTAKYQWYGDQYTKLSAEYARGLTALKGGGAE